MGMIRYASLALPLLAAIPVSAADLPRRNFAPPPVAAYSPVSAFSWTGFYVGVNGGYSWASLGSVGNATFDRPSGFTLGGTAGYNQQFGSFVLGVEGDFNWSNIDSSRRQTINIGAPATPNAVVYASDVNWAGTLRVRAGYAVDRVLLYATGGYAGALLDLAYTNVTTPSGASQSKWAHGYVLGVGLEYAFTRNLSGKAEYLYTALADTGAFSGGVYAARADYSASTVRMGVNYRF
jgi:outer membrane immunogenic protein